jgi:D-arabinose 1-dehydrogenase-like Zn-dependent alcohol dehydrogenase
MVMTAATCWAWYMRLAWEAVVSVRRNTPAPAMAPVICAPAGPWSALTTATGLAPTAWEPRSATMV